MSCLFNVSIVGLALAVSLRHSFAILLLETDLDIQSDLEGCDIHHHPSPLLVLGPCTSRISASLDATSGNNISASQAAQGKDGGVMATSVSCIRGENSGDRLFPSLLVLHGKPAQERKVVRSLPALERERRQATT